MDAVGPKTSPEGHLPAVDHRQPVGVDVSQLQQELAPPPSKSTTTKSDQGAGGVGHAVHREVHHMPSASAMGTGSMSSTASPCVETRAGGGGGRRWCGLLEPTNPNCHPRSAKRPSTRTRRARAAMAAPGCACPRQARKVPSETSDPVATCSATVRLGRPLEQGPGGPDNDDVGPVGQVDDGKPFLRPPAVSWLAAWAEHRGGQEEGMGGAGIADGPRTARRPARPPRAGRPRTWSARPCMPVTAAAETSPLDPGRPFGRAARRRSPQLR